MPFLSFSKFPQLKKLAEHHEAIAAEVPAMDKWMKWVSDAQDSSGHCSFLDGDWTVFPVYLRGDRTWQEDMSLPEGASEQAVAALDQFFATLPQRFPRTTELIQSAGSVRFAGFSRLHPKSKIELHEHEDVGVRIMHVGIQVPEGGQAGIEVGGDTQVWSQPGDAVIFDDTLPHRAWNDSDQERIVLYLAIERSVVADE